MRKNILLLLPLVFMLGSCGIDNQETVNELKDILIKQDLSEFKTKSFKGTYLQEYDVLDITYDEEEKEKTSYYFNYGGYGIFGYYYDLNDEQYNEIADEKGNVDPFDAIATGTGSYGIVHLSRSTSFNRTGSLEAEINSLDVVQNVTLKTTDENVWVDNSLDITNEGVFHYESMQRLSAEIDKELLFSSVSKRTFHDIFSKVDLYDAPGNIEHLDNLYYSICAELLTKSNKEISDFIIENQISIVQNENIEVNFVFSNENLDEEEFDYIFPGEISGTLTFDKDTYEFLGFNYDMLYNLETFDEETGDSKFVNTRFNCYGEATRTLPEDPWEPKDPKVYDDVSEFLKDVNEQVVPPTLDF